jgi:hypothetical protein
MSQQTSDDQVRALSLEPCVCGAEAVIHPEPGTKGQYFACCKGKECEIETGACETPAHAVTAWALLMRQMRTH